MVVWFGTAFFIASVNKANSSLNLFCCHRLSDAYITNKKREEIIIRFDVEENWDHFVASDNRFVHVGPPILSWNIDDVSNGNEFRDMFNLICRKHILSAKESLNTRRVGWVENIYWKTNKIPEVCAFKSTCSSKPGEMIEDITGLMMPYFLMLMDECTRATDDHWPKELLSLVEKNIKLIQKLKVDS